MQMVGLALSLVGAIVAAVGSIWLLVVAFQHHWGWGLACLCIPFAALVFVIKYWSEGGKPFLIALAGNVVAVIGNVIAASGGGGGGAGGF
jgi:hypothetical protein